jgi:hypothetical protein
MVAEQRKTDKGKLKKKSQKSSQKSPMFFLTAGRRDFRIKFIKTI